MTFLESERHILEIIIDRFYPKNWSNSKILITLRIKQILEAIVQRARAALFSCPAYFIHNIIPHSDFLFRMIEMEFPQGILTIKNTLDEFNQLSSSSSIISYPCPAFFGIINEMYDTIYINQHALNAMKALQHTTEMSGSLESLQYHVQQIEIAIGLPNYIGHWTHVRILKDMIRNLHLHSPISVLTEFFVSHTKLLYEAKFRLMKHWLMTVQMSPIDIQIVHLLNLLKLAEGEENLETKNKQQRHISTLAKRLQSELEQSDVEMVYCRDDVINLLKCILQQSIESGHTWKWGRIGEPYGYVIGKSIWKQITDVDILLYSRGPGFDYSIPESTQTVLDNHMAIEKEMLFFKHILNIDRYVLAE